ncbi:unnamed protein product, partial [Protopolystoma xenopodis]
MIDRRVEIRIWQNRRKFVFISNLPLVYNLQKEAPKPIAIICTCPTESFPQYGDVYHGSITRSETERLLENAPSGSYLIRASKREEGAVTLVIRFVHSFDGQTKNFKLNYDGENMLHYVGEQRFDSVELLVADGLIHFYVESRGADVLARMAEASNYEMSPYYKARYQLVHPSADRDNCIKLSSS